MMFPLAQIFCGMPPPIVPRHVPPITQPITDGTFILPPSQSMNLFEQDAEVYQPPPGSSSLLSSPVQHQVQCLQAVHKSIQQFNQHLKAQQLDRKTLQLFVLQLQNDFALLLYLLFSSVGTLPTSENSIKNSATSPLVNLEPNPNPTSTALPLPCVDKPKLRRFTPEGAVGPPRVKTNNSSNALPNTREAPSTTAQNLTSRISKLGKIFADELAAYTSITAGIQTQYFNLYDKIRQLEAGNSVAIFWKILSVKFVFDSAKVGRSSPDPLIEPATIFSSPIFRTHPHGYNFFINFYPYGAGPATGKCATILFTLFPGDYDKQFQWSFSKLVHIGIRDQLDPLNTWTRIIQPDQDPAYKKPTISTKKRTFDIHVQWLYSPLLLKLKFFWVMERVL